MYNPLTFAIRFFNTTSLNLYARMHYTSHLWNSLSDGNFKYLIRVDDFPRSDFGHDDFMHFHEVMHSFDCPYLLGVTPFLPTGVNKIELDFLRNSDSNNVSLSLHGFTHEKLGSKKYQGEIDCYSREEIKELIIRSKSFFSDIGVEYPDSFIPPFNIIDKDTYSIISNKFKFIMGGPVSLTTLGLYRFSEKLHSSLFIPSYFPFYGKTSKIIKDLERVYPQKDAVMVVTLHWAWEIQDDFKSLRQFLAANRSRIVNYKTAKQSWIKNYESS